MRKLKNEELKRKTIEEFKNTSKLPIVIVLDNIRSGLNVGSVFRTADAFLIEKIYLCGITAKPPNKEINKTALGATHSVDWEYITDTKEIVKKLKLQGYKIISIEQVEGAFMLNELTINNKDKYALIFGNEITGVDQQVVDLSDIAVEIPQFGTKHSLNISVSAGIVIWEFVRKIGLLLDFDRTKC